MENLSKINEDIRQQLINLENIRKELTEVKVDSKIEGKLREHVIEILNTCTADFFILSDFLFEAENCIDESDLEFLLDVYVDKETVN